VRTPLTTGRQALAHLLPGMNLVGGKLLTRERMKPRGSLGHPWHGTAQHQGRRGAFSPGRPPCRGAMRANALVQIMIGTREVRHARAVEQAGPSTAADREQVVDGGGERARVGWVPCQSAEEPVQAPLHRRLAAVAVVVQEGSGTMHPALGHTHVGPQGGGVLQPPLAERLQTSEVRGQGPLFSPRSLLWAMALRRSWR
jgi:hypothetical protein